MVKRLRAWFNSQATGNENQLPATNHFLSLVQQNQMDRRSNFRIRIPTGFFEHLLPQVFVMDHSAPKLISLADISYGGICMRDAQNRFRLKVGSSVTLIFRFKADHFQVIARVVGESLGRRHLQFTEEANYLKPFLTSAMQCAHLGTLFREASQPNYFKTSWQSLWLTTAGDRLELRKTTDDIDLLGYILVKSPNEIEFTLSRNEPMQVLVRGRSASSDELERIAIVIANIRSESMIWKPYDEKISRHRQRLR